MRLIEWNMKTLVLIRHAKSSWDHDVIDLQRPLSERGFNDAHLVSKVFASIGLQPDAVFSSPANRALTTCKIFVKHLDFKAKPLIIDDQLYDFGGNKVLRFIESLDDELEKVILFGHNHAFTSLTNKLGDSEVDNLPTAGLVMIEFGIDRWQDINRGATKMILKPSDYR